MSAIARNVDEPYVEKITPFSMTVIFSTINFLLYQDRGFVAASLTEWGKPTSFNVDDTQKGILSFVYMFGYIIASPIFGNLAKTSTKPIRLMAWGLAIWVLSSLIAAYAFHFPTLVIGRSLSGVGEASFLILAPPFIDAFAPKESKSKWLSIFYCTIPVGIACGTIIGTSVITSGWVNKSWAWRIPFIGQGIIMTAITIAALELPGDFSFANVARLRKQQSEDNEYENGVVNSEQYTEDQTEQLIKEDEIDRVEDSEGVESESMWVQFKKIMSPIYIFVVLGYTAQTFVVGAFAYWGKTYIEGQFHVSPDFAASSFGAITVFNGIFGTATGGMLLDKVRDKRLQDEKLWLQPTLKLIATSSFCAMFPCLFAFWFKPMYLFFIFLTVGEFFIFVCLGPINSAVMWSTDFKYRPLAISISVFSIHMLGDAVSPVIIGAIFDAYTINPGKTNQQVNRQPGMFFASLFLVISAAFFFQGWRVSKKIKPLHESINSPQDFPDTPYDVLQEA